MNLFGIAFMVPEFLTCQAWQYSNRLLWIWICGLLKLTQKMTGQCTCYYKSTSVRYAMRTYFLPGNEGSELQRWLRLPTCTPLLFVGISLIVLSGAFMDGCETHYPHIKKRRKNDLEFRSNSIIAKIFSSVLCCSMFPLSKIYTSSVFDI